jgi:hypothetical protein
MLKIDIDLLDENFIVYICPYCGAVDSHYIITPTICYGCGMDIEFEIEDLLLISHERARFYFESTTKSRMHVC